MDREYLRRFERELVDKGELIEAGWIMGILEEDAEPTDADLKRMSLINDELGAFAEAFAKKHGISWPPPNG